MTRVLMLSKACIVGIYQRKLEHIAAAGIDLLVLVPPSWKDERGEQKLERVYTQGYQLQSIPIRWNGNFHLHHYPTLQKWMREFQPDIVHIDEEPYNLATWQALRLAQQNNAKTLIFTWQNILRNYPPPFAWGEAWALRKTDYLLAGTDSAGEIMRQKGYSGYLRTIPQFGTDPDLFHPPKTHPKRPFTIGYIGRLVEEKGVQHLLQAVAKLHGNGHLRLVGSGPLKETLMQQAKTLNITEKITWIEWVASTEMPGQYHELDVMVLPSLTRPNWKEQFGRVLVEAMASGVTLIGSDSGAIPGVIGDGGLVFKEGDVDDLSAKLQSLLDKPEQCQSLAKKGRQRVLKYFTHERVALDTVEVYQEMMRGEP